MNSPQANLDASILAELTPLLELLKLKLADGQRYSEYELMTWLQAPEQSIFKADALQHSHTLFQSHFLLMHALYHLQQHWLIQQEAFLTISALEIYKQPWKHSSTQQHLAEHDPLANYYLDLNQLLTSEEEVNQLLARFWKKMLQPSFIQQDLVTLELIEPVSTQDIRRQYRRLAMRHHPDRGGNAGRFHAIQVAYQRLKHK